MTKKHIGIRIERSLLDTLEQLDPKAEDRTELIMRRLRKGGHPL